MQLTRPQSLSLHLPRGWWLLPCVLGGAALWVKILSASLAVLG